MNRTTFLAFAAGMTAAGAAMFLTGLGPGDDHDHDGHDHAAHADEYADAGGMSPEEMMAAQMAAMMPGEHHAGLARTVGTWDAKTSFIMEPGAPPTEGVGTMTCEWVLGGRFVKGDFHMDDMMGMPFDGISYAGYDNLREEFVSTWMDTFSTGVMYMTGHIDENGKHRMEGKGMSPEGEYGMRIVSEWTGDDQFTDTFYNSTPDGSWAESGTISYTRR